MAHQRDVHAYNYGDFPLWDLLFGTFRNPAEFGKEDVGFAEPADRRLGAMLAFRDVSSAVGTRIQKQGDAARPSRRVANEAACAVEGLNREPEFFWVVRRMAA
jgi:hypothetical protein